MVNSYRARAEEPKYLEWVRIHAKAKDGYVANFQRRTTVMLHHAECKTLTANRYCKTTPLYPKLCGFPTLRELLAQVKKEWGTDTILECSKCWRH